MSNNDNDEERGEKAPLRGPFYTFLGPLVAPLSANNPLGQGTTWIYLSQAWSGGLDPMTLFQLTLVDR